MSLHTLQAVLWPPLVTDTAPSGALDPASVHCPPGLPWGPHGTGLARDGGVRRVAPDLRGEVRIAAVIMGQPGVLRRMRVALPPGLTGQSTFGISECPLEVGASLLLEACVRARAHATQSAQIVHCQLPVNDVHVQALVGVRQQRLVIGLIDLKGSGRVWGKYLKRNGGNLESAQVQAISTSARLTDSPTERMPLGASGDC